jgi:hypothetical protein
MPLLPSVASSSMHGAVVPIAYASLSSAGNISFTNIPQTYQDLYIVLSIKNQSATAQQNCVFYLNGDTATNKYSDTWLNGDGSSATSSRYTTSTGLYPYIGTIPDGSTSAPASFIVHILNYANTSTYKTVIARGAGDANGSGNTTLSVSLYQSTSGISQVLFGGGGAILGAGTTMEIFGIRTVGQ